MGLRHAQTLLELNKSISFICNKSEDKFASIKEVLGEKTPKLTTDLNEVFESKNVDTVVIATGPHQHYDLAKKALLANKHVICEKPFVFSIEESNELFDLAAAKGKRLIVHFSDLYSYKIHNLCKLTHQAIEDKKSFAVYYQNFGNGPWRDDYSVMWDYGSHAAAFLLRTKLIVTKFTNCNVIVFDKQTREYHFRFSDKELNQAVDIQIGNCHYDRFKGLSFSFPASYLKKGQDENSRCFGTCNLKEEKTLNNLYLHFDNYISVENYFAKDELHEYFKWFNSSVINFCLFYEKKTKEIEESTNA